MKKIILSLGILLLPCLVHAGNITISAAHTNGNILQVVSSDTATSFQTNSASLVNTNLGCSLTTIQSNSKILIMAMTRLQIETIGNTVGANIYRSSTLLSNNWISAPSTAVNEYKYPTLIAVESPAATAGTLLSYRLQILSGNTNAVDANGEQYMICEEIGQ